MKKKIVMEKEIKNEIMTDMRKVTDSTNKIREYLMSDSISYEEKVKMLKIYGVVIADNKNAVSASIVKIHISKM